MSGMTEDVTEPGEGGRTGGGKRRRRALVVSGAWTVVAVEVARGWRGAGGLVDEMVRVLDSEARWRDPMGWVGWGAFGRMLGVLAGRLDGPREWFRFGREMGVPGRPLPVVARWSLSPARLTGMALRDLRRRLVPEMRVHWHQSQPPHAQYELSLPLSGRAAETFFWITAGQAAVVPVALGLPESLVDVRCKDDSALLDVRLPPSGTLAARAGRLLWAGVSLRRSSATLAAREYDLARAHHALGSLARDFRQIVDASPQGIVIQGASGQLLYANPAFARSVGLSEPAAVAGRRLAELVAIDGIDERAGGFNGASQLLAARDATAPPVSLRGRLLTPDRWGEEVFFEVAGAQSVDFDGQPARLVFCRDITQRRRLEREVVEASEEERRRVALELHDGLGQLLAALSMQAQALGLRLQSAQGNDGAGSTASELATTAHEALALARSLARGLAPVATFEGGLPFALERLARRVEAASGLSITVAVDLPDDFSGAGEEVDLHCYRIAQEALHNVVRHAQASEVALALQLEPDGRRLRLTVTDNGRGMQAAANEASVDDGGGLGIRAMHYRAASVGGSVEMGAGPDGTGSRVTLIVPLAAPMGSSIEETPKNPSPP